MCRKLLEMYEQLDNVMHESLAELVARIYNRRNEDVADASEEKEAV